jgi:glycoside/pentoside/hexuronide:cation symporter, GPH family
MTIPFAITGILAFYTPDLGPTGKLIYAFVTYALVMMAYSSINIPYGALMGVITPSSIERTSVSTYRFVLAFCGGIIVQYGTLKLVAFFGGAKLVTIGGAVKSVVVNERQGFFWTMVVFSVTAVILFLICFATTKERVQPPEDQKSTFQADLKFLLTNLKFHQIFLCGLVLLSILGSGFSAMAISTVLVAYIALSTFSWAIRGFALRRFANVTEPSSFEADFNDLLTNRPWMVLFAFGLLHLSGCFVRSGATLYYFKYFAGDVSLASSFLVVGSLAAIAGMLLTKPLTQLFGKKWLMIGANTGVAFLFFCFAGLRSDQVYAMFGLQIAASFISGSIPVLLWAMYADTADYSEWRTRRRATGLVFAAATFSQKLGCALGIAMTGFVLDFYCYRPPSDGIDQTQSEATLVGLRMMMSLIPAVFLLACAACLLFYNIDSSLAKQIEEDLQTRRCTAS